MVHGRLSLGGLECTVSRRWTCWGRVCPGPRALIVLSRQVQDNFPGGGHADYAPADSRHSAEITTVGAFRQMHMKIGYRYGKSPTQVQRKRTRGMKKQHDIAQAMSSR
jgi:hypothetical protein